MLLPGGILEKHEADCGGGYGDKQRSGGENQDNLSPERNKAAGGFFPILLSGGAFAVLGVGSEVAAHGLGNEQEQQRDKNDD